MAYATLTRSRQIPLPARLALRRLPPGSEYLGEDRYYYHFVKPGGSLGLGELGSFSNMFARMLKFTPKSFTPGNIYKGFINTVLTTSTAGLYQVLPKNFKKSVYEIGKVAVPVVAGGVLAYMAGPAIMAALGPKLASAGSMLGKAAGAVGGGLMDLMGKMPQHAQAQVASQITPEQIAQWDQTGRIPSSLENLLGSAMQNSLPPSGAASLYDPSAMAAAEVQRRQAEAAAQGGGFDWSMLAMIGLPAVAGVYWLTTRK